MCKKKTQNSTDAQAPNFHGSIDFGSRTNWLRYVTEPGSSPRPQEAQLMLTNLRDAFICQSRSPNIVPFHMLGIFPLVQ